MKFEEDIQLPISLSLAPYSGPWDKQTASHLLRRCMFGPTYQEVSTIESLGLNGAVAQLLSQPAQTFPLAFSSDETIVPIGTTWVNQVYPSTNGNIVDNTRKLSMYSWMLERVNKEGLSIQEKMCLFWTNHFGVDLSFDARSIYSLNELYRINCLGNFKQLVKDVTINPAMLVFLNGTSNNLYSPNENYARELLELFTVGKGIQVGPGDYSTYTESDIHESAKVLTGWIAENWLSSTAPNTTSSFVPTLHDTSTKTFSSYFGGASIPDGGANEYATWIDLIFQQAGSAKHICRKLYRWFVNYDLTATVEATVINDMATTLEANNYSIMAVMDELLRSEHFYDASVRGAIIRNPLEFMFGMYNPTQAEPTAPAIEDNYALYQTCYWINGNLGMFTMNPPNVGGWFAYYQAPSFSKLWGNSSYIKSRSDVSAWFTLYGGPSSNGNNFKVDAMSLINGLSAPSNPVQVIDDIALVFTPKGLSSTKKIMLKTILLNGQPDFEWTIQFNQYLADPTNPVVVNPVKQRIELVLARLFQLPEYHTI